MCQIEPNLRRLLSIRLDSLVRAGVVVVSGPVASALANKFGIRAVTVAGSVIASLAFFLSTFTTSLNQLIFVYGVVGGQCEGTLGASRVRVL